MPSMSSRKSRQHKCKAAKQRSVHVNHMSLVRHVFRVPGLPRSKMDLGSGYREVTLYYVKPGNRLGAFRVQYCQLRRMLSSWLFFDAIAFIISVSAIRAAV